MFSAMDGNQTALCTYGFISSQNLNKVCINTPLKQIVQKNLSQQNSSSLIERLIYRELVYQPEVGTRILFEPNKKKRYHKTPLQ